MQPQGPPSGLHPVGLALRDVLTWSGRARAAMARRLGLGLREVEAMEHVMLSEDWPGEPRIGAADLARLLGVTTAASTQLLHRLEADRHVEREPHPTDRRRVVLRATGSGRDHVMQQLGPLLAALGAVARELSPEDAAVVERYLRDVEAVFRRFAATDSFPPTTGGAERTPGNENCA